MRSAGFEEGEHGEWVVAAAGGDQLLRQRGVHDRTPSAIRSRVSMNSATSLTRLLSR
jgi:hypothetical protein